MENSKLKTKEEQIKYIHWLANWLTERIWEILDRNNVSYNTECDDIAMGLDTMFNDMHRDFFSLLVGQLSSVLGIKPHPEIEKDRDNKVFKEWASEHLEEITFLSEARIQKIDEIIRQKTEN